MASDDLDPREDEAEAGEGEPSGKCCKSVFENEVNADDMALIAVLTGTASMFLTMHFQPGLRLLGLLCGATGVVGGYLAQKAQSRREKQAIAGMICGTIGLVFWLLVAATPH